MDENDANVERAQDGDVEQDVGKIFARDNFAVDADDENLFAKARNVLQDAPQVGQFHNVTSGRSCRVGIIFSTLRRECKCCERFVRRLGGVPDGFQRAELIPSPWRTRR
jgi:hypothetical protein